MTIYEDTRTVPRADLAAWLRQIADQLEEHGRIFHGAAGAVEVPDRVECELEIERERDGELSVEIEFSWRTAQPAGDGGEPDEGGGKEPEAGDGEKADAGDRGEPRPGTGGGPDTGDAGPRGNG